MKRIYVAGAFSSNNILQILDNMRIGMRASLEVLLAGYSPFCPWLDYHFALMLREGEKLEVQDFYDYSLAWLERADALLVLPNWENSVGTKKEIERAREIGIPVYFDFEQLKKEIAI